MNSTRRWRTTQRFDRTNPRIFVGNVTRLVYRTYPKPGRFGAVGLKQGRMAEWQKMDVFGNVVSCGLPRASHGNL